MVLRTEEGKQDEVGEKGHISMRNTVEYPLFVKS